MHVTDTTQLAQTSTDGPPPVYSIVELSEVAYDDPGLTPIPGYLLGDEDSPAGIDPQEIIGTEQNGFMIGIHATDPAVGPGNASSLRSLIGLTVRPPGAFQGVQVPIIPNLTDVRDGQTMPPNPGSAGATLTAKVWRFGVLNGIFGPKPVTVDGSPLEASATMQGGLDLNADVPTLVVAESGKLAPDG
ncbi:MAG: hypothetical protein ABEH88_01885 [Halobacteriales archaeon]